MKRFSILGLMGLVVVVAVAIASLRYAGGMWAGVLLLGLLGLLGMAVLGVVYGEGRSRAGWLGFLVFGGGYATITCCPGLDTALAPRLPTSQLLQLVHSNVVGPQTFQVLFSALTTSSQPTNALIVGNTPQVQARSFTVTTGPAPTPAPTPANVAPAPGTPANDPATDPANAAPDLAGGDDPGATPASPPTTPTAPAPAPATVATNTFVMSPAVVPSPPQNSTVRFVASPASTITASGTVAIQDLDQLAVASNRWKSLMPGAANLEEFSRVGHALFGLLAGLLGTLIARRFAPATAAATITPPAADPLAG